MGRQHAEIARWEQRCGRNPKFGVRRRHLQKEITAWLHGDYHACLELSRRPGGQLTVERVIQPTHGFSQSPLFPFLEARESDTDTQGPLAIDVADVRQMLAAEMIGAGQYGLSQLRATGPFHSRQEVPIPCALE